MKAIELADWFREQRIKPLNRWPKDFVDGLTARQCILYCYEENRYPELPVGWGYWQPPKLIHPLSPNAASKGIDAGKVFAIANDGTSQLAALHTLMRGRERNPRSRDEFFETDPKRFSIPCRRWLPVTMYGLKPTDDDAIGRFWESQGAVGPGEHFFRGFCEGACLRPDGTSILEDVWLEPWAEEWCERFYNTLIERKRLASPALSN